MNIINNYIQTYRVEKDGVSFHVRVDMLDYYVSKGYTVYRQIEEPMSTDDIQQIIEGGSNNETE